MGGRSGLLEAARPQGPERLGRWRTHPGGVGHRHVCSTSKRKNPSSGVIELRKMSSRKGAPTVRSFAGTQVLQLEFCCRKRVRGRRLARSHQQVTMGHMGGRRRRPQRVGLSRSSQGQANRSTKPPSQSSKATDESELREDGPAESVIAEPTAAGLAAAESATAATAAGMAAPESATRREPVSTRLP